MNDTIKQIIIVRIVNKADEHNRVWLRLYLENNIDQIVEAVGNGQPLKFGFRGLEVKEEMAYLLREGFLTGI